MRSNKGKADVDGYYCPKLRTRWTSYGTYKLVLWAWMLNEITIVFTPTELSHSGFYIHAFLQAISLAVIGLPLVYSEICLGQYSNCNIFTMWNFFPLFKNVGYASFFAISIKATYLLVLTSWYLIYTFYAAMDTPPWLNCDEFEDCKCMVKRINVPIFQHCLEAESLFNEDCGMKSASKCFFEREIGDNSTLLNSQCYRPWKLVIGLLVICITVYILSIKNEKIIQIVIKFYVIYICLAILLMFGRALSTSGTWYSKKIKVNWSRFTFGNTISTSMRGFLSVGTGLGVIVSLSRDVSFRSPATMTAITVSFFTFFVSFMLTLIAFNGIKTMSYHHGEEQKIIELGSDPYFLIFASISEILNYYDPLPIWSFVWFSTGFICLFLNFWILYIFLKETMFNICSAAQSYTKLSSLMLMVIIYLLTLPLLCVDIAGILIDATEMMQIFNSFLLSFSLYWVYGIQKHNVDIIFMIGIKANYFLKLAWLINPILLFGMFYREWIIVLNLDYENSLYLSALGTYSNRLFLYIIIGIYSIIIIIGVIMQIIAYGLQGKLREVISPVYNWGPRDSILFRSRNMFLPEIMTREFLYRQVRIRGYKKIVKNKCNTKVVHQNNEEYETVVRETSWSALTSN